MFNTIIEIKRENKEGQLNIKINLYHNNEEELNKIVKATSKFKFYNDTTITNNDGSLSYTKATNIITINNIAEELLNFDNNIKELENLFIAIGAEPLILEGYLKSTDKKEYKEDMEKAGNDQNIEENTKINNMEMNKILKILEGEIKVTEKEVKKLIKNDKYTIAFNLKMEIEEMKELYKKFQKYELISIVNSCIDVIILKDKKDIEYSVLYYKNNKSLHVQYKINDVIYNIFKLPNDEYILDVIKNNKHRNYSRVGKDKQDIYYTLTMLYRLIKNTRN